jgi:hypothetical protein
VRTTYLLRGGQALSPEHVAVHWQLTTLALPATAGTETGETGTTSVGEPEYGVPSTT